MQLLELFPGMYEHDLQAFPLNFDTGGFRGFGGFGSIANTPVPDIESPISTPSNDTNGGVVGYSIPHVPAPALASSLKPATPKPAAATATSSTPPSPRPTSAQPNTKPRSKGRSGGDQSSTTIKALRAQAENGDLEAALKLGWGVARLTKIFNAIKAANGEKVTPDQPIDDEELLARISEKHKYQAEVQKKRQEKLRKMAYAGDWQAAKKLKLGKRTMEELFPHIKDGEDVEEDEQARDPIQEQPKLRRSRRHQVRKKTEDLVVDVDEDEDVKSPAEPFDFEKERELMSKASPLYDMSEMLDRGPPIPPNPYLPGKVETEGMLPWATPPAPDYFATTANRRNPYPTEAPQQFGFEPERALRRHYAAAIQEVAFAQANLSQIKRQLERLQAERQRKDSQAAKDPNRVAKTPNPTAKKRKTVIKLEDDDGPKNLRWYKKTKQARPSNFPTESNEDYHGHQMQSRGFGLILQ